MERITIERFLELARSQPVFDVRSPGEYVHAHIPAAHSLPLFTDEERKVVGTAYKQQSRENAIKTGLDFFGPKMRDLVEDVEKIIKLTIEKKEPPNNKSNEKQETCLPDRQARNAAQRETRNVLLHCWRGGMRSAAVAWLLDLYGFKVYTLEGGYKAYRNWVLQQFEKEYNFKIIGGYTGSGKTPLLHEIEKGGHAIIDLEASANHKGSALGGIGQEPQPSQEMFENVLAAKLAFVKRNSNYREQSKDGQPPTANCIFLEDESQRIGNLQIPMALWNTMRKSAVLFMDIPFEARLIYLTEEYSIHPNEKLVNAVTRIQKRLGGLETKNAINFLLEENHKEAFRILLKYYDKWYAKGLHNRENANELIQKIPATNVDTEVNIKLIKQQSLQIV